MTSRTATATLCLLGGIALLLTLACVELAVRYQAKAWPFETPMVVPAYLKESEARLRWRFSSEMGRNSLGLRNREVGAKTPQDIRVLFLGDSLIWSGETSSGQLYTEVIESRLRQSVRRRETRLEVINAAIPGYTTYQELEFLKLHGLHMNPDLVVLGFVFNDLYHPYLHKPTAGRMLDMEPSILLNRFDTNAFPGRLFARSYAAHRTARKARETWRKLSGRPIFPFEQHDDFYLAWTAHGWDNTTSLLTEMRDLLARQGARFVIVVFPVVDQVDDTYRALDLEYVLYPLRRIAAICASIAVTCLDLTEALRAAGGKALYRDYLHLNVKGNDVVADEITRFLQSDPTSRLAID